MIRATAGSVRTFLMILAVALAACAHGPPPSRRTTRLVLETSDAGTLPFVFAEVAGERLQLLVDTGAFRSMISPDLARARRLRWQSAASDEELVDANGRVTRMPILSGVPVRFEGESTVEPVDFLVNPRWTGDKAILAAQDLVRRGWALVLDLERQELAYEPEEAALKRRGADGSPLREVDYRVCRDEGLFSRAHRIIPATVNRVHVEMLLDTGAQTTALARNNPALPSMIAREGSRGAVAGIGSVGQALVLEDVPIAFSNASFVTPVLVVPASQQCAHGALGADLLRHCTIVWGWSSLWMACRVPPAG